MSSSVYPIDNVLKNSDTQLGKLIAQARAIEELNHTFSTILDSDLIPHCRVGCYHSGLLTLFVESAAYATLIRYQVPTLLSQLRSHKQWAGLCTIQIKIQTFRPQDAIPAPAPPVAPPSFLPAVCAAQLRLLADSLKNEPNAQRLVASLERLAKHQGLEKTKGRS